MLKAITMFRAVTKFRAVTALLMRMRKIFWHARMLCAVFIQKILRHKRYKIFRLSWIMSKFSWWSLRLLAVVLSVMAVAFIIYMPSQTRLLHYNPNNHYFLLTDIEHSSASQATWLDDYSYSRFKCSIISIEITWCGWGISWPYNTNGLMDLSSFHSVRIKLKYVGQAKKIRIYMRNYHESYGDLASTTKNKFQSVIVPAHEFDRVVTIPLREFVVAEWWVTQFNIAREHAAPDFTAIKTFAIDFPQPGAAGEHVMEIQRVELVGELIAKETAYLSLLVFWLLVLALEGGYRYYQMNRQVERAYARTLTLATYARELRTQRSLYKRLSGVDPLTGIYNRAGIKPLLKKSFEDNRRKSGGAVMVIDIDHFKRVNDQYGHSMGDDVIKSVAHVIMDVIRLGDLFARWGGEEFVLFCPNVDCNTAQVIGEKLRQAVCDSSYSGAGSLTVTVSLGVTIVRADDSFEQAFERADQALYQAKQAGRNRIVFFDYDESPA